MQNGGNREIVAESVLIENVLMFRVQNGPLLVAGFGASLHASLGSE